MNVSDSERIAGFLERYGLEPADDDKTADLIVINTCGVRQMAEDRIYGLVHNLREDGFAGKIVITGCLADRKDVQRRLRDKVDLFCRIKDFNKLENWIIGNCLEIRNSKLEILAQKDALQCDKNIDYLSTLPKYTNPHEALVPIMTGCNNFCSYCVVPYARGWEISRPVEEIISEIDALAKNNCQEIILLGQNVNSYSCKFKKSILRLEDLKLEIDWKLEIGNWKFKRQPIDDETVNFPLLLDVLAKNYPDMRWRFLTSHPKDFSQELMEVIADHENISREIHLPVQSGSDKILGAMNRPYTQKHYLDLIAQAQEIIPGVSFTTDVIVGFPGETEEDFQATVAVFEKVRYNEAYINKYSPRPGTAAEKLGDPIDWEEKKRREKVLRKIVQKP